MTRSGETVKRAAKQGGYITRKQLIEMGLSASAISRRVDSGELARVIDGVYQVFPPSDHSDLIRGAVLGLPGAAASHESAAHLLSLPQLPVLKPTVTVPSHTTHRFPGVEVRRSHDLVPSHTTTVDHIRVTNVQRTVFDLAGVLEFKEFEQIAEAAILGGRLQLRHLVGMLDQLGRRGKRGTTAMRDFLSLRDVGEPNATRLERIGREVLAKGGFPPPIPQFRIPWDPQRRFDDAYPDYKVAIEWDSRSWHAQLEAMTSDRKRDREAAAHGWQVVRFTWHDVTKDPDEVIRSMSNLLDHRRMAS